MNVYLEINLMKSNKALTPKAMDAYKAETCQKRRHTFEKRSKQNGSDSFIDHFNIHL